MRYAFGILCGVAMIIIGLAADSAPSWIIWFGSGLVAVGLLLAVMDPS